jgi:hypothetical protein
VPKRKSKTAAELIRELEADPEWVAARDERDRQLAERKKSYDQDQAGLVDEIRQLGYEIDSVWDLVNNSPHPVLERTFTGPYTHAYAALIRHLDVSHLPRVREGIIRALTVPDLDTASKNALLRHFESEADSELRWALANALRVALSEPELAAHPEVARALG